MAHVLESISKYEQENLFQGKPEKLYEAKNYLISLGGKRARPAALLSSCLAFGGRIDEAMKAAWSFELFHNFTLAHDDIMDDAPLRRGKAAVHEKYDVPTSILAGDNMMLYVYQYLLDYPAEIALDLSKLLTQTGIEICEGQYMDMSFEEMDSIQEEEYIEMIKLKTSVLLAASLKAGAAIAKAPIAIQDRMYELGILLGIGFQIKDDLLDAFSTNPKVGKVQGGDILANKKTILWTRFMKLASKQQKDQLNALFSQEDMGQKVEDVLTLFNAVGVQESVSSTMDGYYDRAWEVYNELETKDKTALGEFISYITERQH